MYYLKHPPETGVRTLMLSWSKTHLLHSTAIGLCIAIHSDIPCMTASKTFAIQAGLTWPSSFPPCVLFHASHVSGTDDRTCQYKAAAETTVRAPVPVSPLLHSALSPGMCRRPPGRPSAAGLHMRPAPVLPVLASARWAFRPPPVICITLPLSAFTQARTSRRTESARISCFCYRRGWLSLQHC
jgi:hypothetical protein